MVPLKRPTMSMITWLCLCLILPSLTVAADITIVDHGYENVVVAISPDVDGSQADEIIDGIKNWISAGSKSLYTATEGYAYIASVKILAPSAWDVDSTISGVYNYQDGHIIVKEPNPVYADGPYTVQTGTCGSRGELIHVTPAYLTNLEGLSAEAYGPPEHVFAHEWSKFRYGVFNEYGYPGDNMYPAFYINPRDATELLPNFCTIKPLRGYSMDAVTGGPCVYDEVTGLPDCRCVFVPDGDNDFATTSLLATPFLASTEFYCNDQKESMYHDYTLPNKHNALCDGRNTYSVVKGNIDFDGMEAPLDAEIPPETDFEVIQQEDGKFVLVLDRSTSMDYGNRTRFEYLKQSTMRWIKHDIDDGSKLGIVSFCEDAVANQDMTVVTDSNRDDMMEIVDDLYTDPSTCLGMAVKKGIEVMSQAGHGGVMIFFTDGNQECDSEDDSTITDPEVIQAVIDSEIRIITIAIGPDADPNIENLATISDGKTYFIPDDGGLDSINDALQGSLTYQPAVPTEELDFVIFKDELDHVDGMTDVFYIDRTIGRDVQIQVDYIFGEDQLALTELVITPPDGITLDQSIFPFKLDSSKVFIVKFDFLEVGEYKFEIVAKSEVTYLNVVVLSKALEGSTLPFRTNCWFSSGDGSNPGEADLSNGDPLSVVAEVTQGDRPVMNARVRAFIEREDTEFPIEQDLYDNGLAPDLVAFDGLYSRYFSVFDGDTRYLLRCQVEGTEDTDVNGGFVNTKREMLSNGKTYTYPMDGTPPCCGSTAFTENSAPADPTGSFFRETVGGSIRITGVSAAGTDVFAPAYVSDLRTIIPEQNEEVVQIMFTAPGDDLFEGIAARYDLFASPINQVIVDEDYTNATQLQDKDFILGDLTPVTGMTSVTLQIDQNVLRELVWPDDIDPVITQENYFFRMNVYDEADNMGKSNSASVTLVKPVIVEPTPEITTVEPTTPFIVTVEPTAEPLPTTEPEPTTTEPIPTTEAEPTTTEPMPTTEAEPTTTEPMPTTEPEPTTTEPTTTEPMPTTEAEPTTTEPMPTTEAEPTTSEPEQTSPVVVTVMSTTEEPEPTKPEPTKPVPTEPEPTEPKPTEPAEPSSSTKNSVSCITMIVLSLTYIFNILV